MANVFHLRCQHCGEALADNSKAYCPPCNIYLCYRAMPILLGMLFPWKLMPRPVPARVTPPSSFQAHSYDDDPCIFVDYPRKKSQRIRVGAYEEELCIMVTY